MSKKYIAKIELEMGGIDQTFYLHGKNKLNIEGGAEYKSPSAIRTILYTLLLNTLDEKSIKDLDKEYFEKTVFTHDKYDNHCPCYDCTNNITSEDIRIDYNDVIEVEEVSLQEVHQRIYLSIKNNDKKKFNKYKDILEEMKVRKIKKCIIKKD